MIPGKTSLQARKEKLDDDLLNIHRQIYNLEGCYLMDTNHHGNIIKGWDGQLSQTEVKAVHGSRKLKINEKDRIFTQSSVCFVRDLEHDSVYEKEDRYSY